MNNKNDSRFLSPWGQRLAELGLEVKDVNVGRYVQIDMSHPRPEPEEFAEFGEFDTFTVLNPHEVPVGVWLYLNNKRPENRMPLHYISRLETIADRFYLQHDDGWDGVTLHIILGGDLRALSIEPSSKGVINIGGSIDVSDRSGRKLGIVSVEDVATETTLSRIRDDIGSIATTDFATQTTLEGVRVLLATLAQKDFATQTTLEDVRALLADIYAELQTQTGLLERLGDNTVPPGTAN